MKISPAIKGMITAVLMISVILVIFNMGKNADARLQYAVYAIYAIGIVWTLVAFRQTAAYTGSFGNLFNQGFRCFIVVTLLMAVFYGVFNYIHPEFGEESAKIYKEQLEASVAKNERLPIEVESEVATYKKQYTLKLVSGAIFGYLIIGVAVTAAISVFLIKRKE
ncbi:MAG: DUF4199 domain-containing protein [Chitinophagaceae bacterium]